MTRRHFFFGLFASAAACTRRTTSTLRTRVTIAKCASYQSDLESLLRQILIDHRVAVAGKHVVLKPNLVELNPPAPINTHPHFVAADYAAFQALGAASVTIAEGPGHRRATLDMAESAGFFTAIRRFEQNFVDLNLDDVTATPLRQPFSKLKDLYLPHTALGADLIVSLPKMKTHHWTGATLSMKNLFGLVPGGVYGWPKNILHWSGIDECVADLHTLFPRQFCLVDGIEAMEGNGPILGTAKRMGLVVAGSHPPSVDVTCCRLMRIDPGKVKYLQLAASRAAQNIWNPSQTGESIAATAQTFALHPDLTHLRL